MTNTDLRARRGDLICFSSGEYSDYGYNGHFVCLEDLTTDHFRAAQRDAEDRCKAIETAQDAWTRESGEPWPGSGDKQEAFIAALIRMGLLASVSVSEFHIGSYGELHGWSPNAAT